MEDKTERQRMKTPIFEDLPLSCALIE
jgi:hypothetical protein